MKLVRCLIVVSSVREMVKQMRVLNVGIVINVLAHSQIK